jgi:molybdate transport system substrate-binding protein
MKKMLHLWAGLVLGLFCLPLTAADPGPAPVTVFAAASLTDVLQSLADGFTRQTTIPVRFSFAASSTLARQIENGAPADVFFSADVAWMDYLQARDHIAAASRRDLLGNHLVLVAPAGNAISLRVGPHFPMAATLGKDHWVTGDPDSVPVGRYARESLTQLGVWGELEPRLVRADSVRAALALVDRGEVPLGIVYATDAKSDPGVRVVDVFPDDTHVPIVYPAALTPSAGAAAARFLAWIGSAAARPTFEKFGFTVLPVTAPP